MHSRGEENVHFALNLDLAATDNAPLSPLLALGPGALSIRCPRSSPGLHCLVAAVTAPPTGPRITPPRGADEIEARTRHAPDPLDATACRSADASLKPVRLPPPHRQKQNRHLSVSALPHSCLPSISPFPPSAPPLHALQPARHAAAPRTMPPSLKRTRLLDLALTSVVATAISVIPFVTVSKDLHFFHPPSARLAFLLAIFLSWPCHALAAPLAVAAYLSHRRAEPQARHIGPDHPAQLTVAIAAAATCATALASLFAAQATWVYVAARTRLTWILALVTLGLAMIAVLCASVLAIFVQAVRARVAAVEDKTILQESHSVAIHVAPDQTIAHEPELEMGRHASDLVF